MGGNDVQVSRVVYLGLVNWIITLIVTRSSLFAPIRVAAAELHPRLGELATCPLCAGTWVGFYQALIVGGPLPGAFWNGLLYKAVAELVQACAVSLTVVGRGTLAITQRPSTAPAIRDRVAGS
jgi:hypothetical protein